MPALFLFIFFYALFADFCFSSKFTVSHIVVKHASPPIKLDRGSAKNTPFTPILFIPGSHNVSGITIIAFLNKEKKMACLDLPNATNVD